MNTLILLGSLACLTLFGYLSGRRRSAALVGGHLARLHSLPGYHGLYVALWCGVPALLVLSPWLAIEPMVLDVLIERALPDTGALSEAGRSLLLNDIRNLAIGNIAASATPETEAAARDYARLLAVATAARWVVVGLLAIAGLALARRALTPRLRTRQAVERALRWFMIGCATLAIFTTVGIVLSLIFETIRFFRVIPPGDFLFGLEWSPQVAIRADQVGSSGSFGAVPLFAGTLLVSLIAMAVAAPIGLLAAIYMSEYANPRARDAIKPVLEILAGIPTVVYGFFAALTVAPLLRGWGTGLGLDVSSESALAAGLVMGVMIIPFVSSLSDDAIAAVPRAQRDGSYALGGTRSETILRVVLPAALPGIVGGMLLAVSRAIGETMIVVMAAGLAANLTANPLQAVTTVTVQIVTLLVGDQEFDSPKTLAAFALGLVLFLVTLVLNMIALLVVRRYREQYE